MILNGLVQISKLRLNFILHITPNVCTLLFNTKKPVLRRTLNRVTLKQSHTLISAYFKATLQTTSGTREMRQLCVKPDDVNS